jgi:hypothetical protein
VLLMQLLLLLLLLGEEGMAAGGGQERALAVGCQDAAGARPERLLMLIAVHCRYCPQAGALVAPRDMVVWPPVAAAVMLAAVRQGVRQQQLHSAHRNGGRRAMLQRLHLPLSASQRC